MTPNQFLKEMTWWNDNDDNDPIEGMIMICKFRYGGEYMTVSSEQMTRDGQKDFNEVWEILYRYVKSEYLVADAS